MTDHHNDPRADHQSTTRHVHVRPTFVTRTNEDQRPTLVKAAPAMKRRQSKSTSTTAISQSQGRAALACALTSAQALASRDPGRQHQGGSIKDGVATYLPTYLPTSFQEAGRYKGGG